MEDPWISLGQAPIMHATCHNGTAQQLPSAYSVHKLAHQIYSMSTRAAFQRSMVSWKK